MRIIVPLDGSPQAERALTPAVQMLRSAQSAGELIIIRVAPLPSVTASVGGEFIPPYSDAMEREEVAACEAYLRAIAARPLYADLTVTTVALADAPVEAIIAQARLARADMIVMTSHGRTGFSHLALGSVAEAVARDSRIPTLIIRAHGQTLPDSGRFEPITMLVPLDGSPLAEAALEPAMVVARILHGAIRLLNVLPTRAVPADEMRSQSRAAYAYLTRVHDRLEQAGITAHRALAWGDPVDQIALEVSRFQTDIIVLATHGRVGLARFLSGSVTEGVLHRVDLPVLIVHPALDTADVKRATASDATAP